jgi:transposase/CheY-like chemotaxis protein
MKRFIEGEDRTQITLLPECLDDYISEDNPIRAVEVFIDELDLGTLGFAGVAPAATGRPSYHPEVLLKLYLYGYLNRIQSSRRLEREAQRNVELMWLTGRLSPDFKTIADFRRDNGPAIRNVCREFILLCRRLNLFSQAAIVAIDGSKFKAVNAHDRNFTQAKLDKRIQEVEHSIDRYLTAMETADRDPSDVTETKTTHLHKKIEHLKQQMQDLKAMQARLQEAPSGQISLTDPDVRAMATSTSRGLVGYNVQTAVDARHHLIVAHEVTNVDSDRRQLVKMAKQAQAVLETPQLQVVADRGYFNGDDILACDEAGITAYVPKPMTSEARAQGRFEKCTPSENRRVSRWEHEAVLEAMQRRLDSSPGMMRIRRQTVEHPFGTIKFWMGARHFQMRTLGHVQTEMSLHVLAYNLKRAIKIVGMGTLIAAMRA